jgi:hypothetical protein
MRVLAQTQTIATRRSGVFVRVSSFCGLADDPAGAPTSARMLAGAAKVTQTALGILLAEWSPSWLFRGRQLCGLLLAGPFAWRIQTSAFGHMTPRRGVG